MIIKKNISIYYYLLTGFLLISCTDVLDRAPDGKLSMDEIWTNPSMVEQMLSSCYTQLPYKNYFYHFWDNLPVACSDDGFSTYSELSGTPILLLYNDRSTSQYHAMQDCADEHGGLTNQYWSRYWQQIRLCSQFIENIDQATVNSEGERARLKAEAHVLRAFYYMELVKWYGRLPVLDATLAFNTDYSTLRRQPVYEVAQLIASDCDVAIRTSELPWRITVASDRLRVNKALAHALKTKALLFAASPLHNEGNNYWEEAYQAGKTAVQALKSNGYELFAVCTNPSVFGDGKAAALHQLVCQDADVSDSPRDKETIYQHYFTGGVFVWHVGYIGCSEPNSFGPGTCPTQELIDAFETEDGVPVLRLSQPYLDERHLQPNYNPANTLYNSNDPYVKRDPRLYITALYNGAQYSWDNVLKKINTTAGGQHEPTWVAGDLTRSRTGYYHKKMVTPGVSNWTNGINSANWKYHRLGELLLDYAEAAAEADHPADALAAANEVRARSGMPALPESLSKDELILRIRNERRVELAWEEQRYFDLRRWQRPDGDLSATCKYPTAIVVRENGDGTCSYTRRTILDNPRGGWQNKDLLLPIPLNEVSNMEALSGVKWQNPGW